MCTRDSKGQPCPMYDATTAGLLTGIVLGFALTAVEADRKSRG